MAYLPALSMTHLPMSYLPALLASLVAAPLSYGAYKLFLFFYAQWTSPLHVLPGPPNAGFLFGHLRAILKADNSVLHENWVNEYGSTLTYNVLFGMKRLYTIDTKAINHVLMNDYIYEKPEPARYNLSQILGSGILVVEGDKHKQQRRIMNPAFGPAQIRELTEIFVEKSLQLRDVWEAETQKAGGTGRIDVLSWLSRMTLDVIGLAGFNYKFNALSASSERSELLKAFDTVFRAGTSPTMLPMMKAMVPALRFLPDERDGQVRLASRTMNRIGKQLLRDSKAAIAADGGVNEKLEKSSWPGRDLLSLLLRANMSTDLPPNQRMTEEDVLAQVPTFLVAGHETTSSATTWALFALTQNVEAQTKLRNELLSVGTDNPTMDELNALPYLDAVVRETLRIHAPVPSTVRVATQDDILPLGEPIKDKYGRVMDGIPIKKGQTLMIPILALNRAKSIWGEDSLEFKPERWETTPDAAASIPGIWGNMMTFLGGPRACIGYRFALTEMKVLLFTLVRAFEFELAVPVEDIGKKSTIVQRPLVLSDPEGGNQMPLLLKSVQ